VSLSEDSRQALARRLKALREEYWPGQGITQLQLAEAIGGKKPLSISLISSWESAAKPVVPPMSRLAAYAGFFATQRSVAQEPFRVLPVSQLTEDERTLREKLLRELTELRTDAIKEPIRSAPAATTGTGLWHFPNLEAVTIVCAKLPADLLREGFSYSDPESPDHVELYKFADLDALVELFGHIRAMNPNTVVHFRTAPDLTPDDYTTHLVLLGGVDWNVVTRDLLARLEVPVRQVVRTEESGEVGGFEVDGHPDLFAPQLDARGRLVEDVAHLYRGLNPFNAKRTVTICNGMYGRGVVGAVRALTDVKFRDRNEAYLKARFENMDAFSIISRVSVVMGQVLTPDWTVDETRLHEWPV
jgi:transcriptional regulator with XRE-family HTH domain